MSAITDIYLFILAGLLLNITPGVDLLYVLNKSIAKGFKAGIVASLGISTGCLFHVVLVVLGLSALLEASPTAFLVVKYIGALYLLYLGITMFLSSKKNTNKKEEDKSKAQYKKIYYSGILINILNPKVALFFITFLPQFINVDSSEKSMGLLILGLIFIAVATIVSSIIAYVSCNISSKFTYKDSFTKYIKKVVGTLFIGFGIKLALDV
ncbi:MAG: lysine transporter LysE [Arcobacter sp.]|nr:MAG: lysine transporter LysE [Arcobacter sp.]